MNWAILSRLKAIQEEIKTKAVADSNKLIAELEAKISAIPIAVEAEE